MNAYELAKKMKVSPVTIYTWVKEGLPHTVDKKGNRYRMIFDLVESKQWLKQKRKGD